MSGLRRIILLIFMFLGCVSQPIFAKSLVIASAAGYKKPMMALYKVFQRQSDVKIEPIFGNMQQILSQADQSGKIALVVGERSFLEDSQVIFSSFRTLGQDGLALAFAKGVYLSNPDELVNPDIMRISMPNPGNAIYGKAAVEFLNNSGLYEKIKNKLFIVSTVPQVSTYLVLKEIDAGFINMTGALAVQDQIGGYLPINPSYYFPIEIVAGVVNGFKSEAGIMAFIGFLGSEDAKKILKEYGL